MEEKNYGDMHIEKQAFFKQLTICCNKLKCKANKHSPAGKHYLNQDQEVHYAVSEDP